MWFADDRARQDIVETLRADYTNDLKSKVMAERQRATAVYFIDRFALRVGGDKDTEAEADTVGCCSLRFEHVTLQEPNLVTFDFLGKDSIRFYQPDKEVDRQVFKNLKLFKQDSKPGQDLFDRITVRRGWEWMESQWLIEICSLHSSTSTSKNTCQA